MSPGAVNRAEGTRVALLDRDGTIIEDPGYLADPDLLRFLPGAVEGLAGMIAAGFRLVVVTNQSGIGRGLLTETQIEAVHERLGRELSFRGVKLAGIYHCPHRPDQGCACRKPGTALVELAAEELGFALTDAVVIGDKASDLELARALGVPGVLVLTGSGRTTLEAHAGLPDYVAAGLPEAARVIAGLRPGPTDGPVLPATRP